MSHHIAHKNKSSWGSEGEKMNTIKCKLSKDVDVSKDLIGQQKLIFDG